MGKRRQNRRTPATALDRLGPPPAPSGMRVDPHRRLGLRVRLARLGGMGLRARLVLAGGTALVR